MLLQIHLYTLNMISNVSWGRNISEHLVVSFAPTVWSGREPFPVGATGISLFVLGTLAAVTAASRWWGRALDDGLRAWLPETAGTDSTRRRLRRACTAAAATVAMTAIFAMGLGRGIRSDNCAGDRACFVVRLIPAAPLGPTEVTFAFAGTNTAAAATLPGVNTLLPQASTTPVPDMVALAATATGDGTLTLAGPGGRGAFAVATANVGASALITASAGTRGVGLPLALLICESDPVTAACKTPPAASVTTQVSGGQTPTFSIFAVADGPVALDPAVNRIFVEFTPGGVPVGRTSVAVRAP